MGFLSKLFGNKEEKVEELVLKAYMKGKVVDITEVPDPVFAQKMMGDGFAIIPEEGGDVTILQQSAVVNEQEARSITLQDKPDVEVLEARLGLLNGEPVWEVNYRMSNQRIGYYYISAKNGKWIKDIENI